MIILVSAFCFVLIGLIWISLLRQLKADKKVAIASAISRNENLVVALEQYAIRTINNAEAVLQLVKMEYQRLGDKVDIKKLLECHSISNDFFETVTIVNEKGEIIKSDLPDDISKELNLNNRPHFDFHINNSNNLLFVGKPVYCGILKKSIISISGKLFSRDGSFKGIVAVHLEPKVFTRFYADANLKQFDIISLIAPDGITYSRRTGSRESFGEDISKSPLFTHVRSNPAGSFFAEDAIRNIPSYFSYRKLKNYPMIATAGTSKQDVLAIYNKRAKRDYISASVISVLILLFSILVCVAFLHNRKFQEKVKSSEEKYRSIVQNSHDAIMLIHSDGSMKAVNPAACRIFGYGESEIAKIKLHDLIEPSDPFYSICSANSPQEHTCKRELFMLRKNGSRFAGEMVASRQSNVRNEDFIVIVRDITERKLAAEKRIADQKRFQRKLTEHVILAQEREREVIGRELHDNVNQVLTMVKLYLEMAVNKQASRDEILEKSIHHILYCINEIRNLSRDLSAPTLGTKSLIDSINALIEMICSSSGLTIHFNHENYKHPLRMDYKLTFYRILQEQLNNVIKHAEATEVFVSLSQNNEFTKLVIKDNGRGFDPSAKRLGIGLNNIMSRAKVLEGRVEIITGKNKGCEIWVELPTAHNTPEKSEVTGQIIL